MDNPSDSPISLDQQDMSSQIYDGADTATLDNWRCSSRIPKDVALGIYQRNFHIGVEQHLQSHFPIAHTYIGEQGYKFICAKYIKASPPEQPIFTIYAAHFPGFLVEFGEQNPQQLIWSVAAQLAQIDFFHHNTFCEGQRIEVESSAYQLWIDITSIVNSGTELPASGLYQLPDLHPEKRSQQASQTVTLVTFWQDDELFFRAE